MLRHSLLQRLDVVGTSFWPPLPHVTTPLRMMLIYSHQLLAEFFRPDRSHALTNNFKNFSPTPGGLLTQVARCVSWQ
jgi:hypothetical protein